MSEGNRRMKENLGVARQGVATQTNDKGCTGIKKAFSVVALSSLVLFTGLGVSNAQESVVGVEQGFKDLQGVSVEGSEKVEFLMDRGVIKGYTDGTFRPDETVTRGGFSAFIARSLDLPESTKEVKFTDVTKRTATYDGITKTLGAGIIEGYPDGSFKPNAVITRKDMALMLNKALQLDKEYSQRRVTQYTDVSKEKYGTTLEHLNYYRILPIYGEKFEPNKEVDRLSAVDSLYNLLSVQGKVTDYSKFTLDDYFEKVEWIQRGTITSLSIHPTTLLLGDAVGDDRSNHITNSFKVLKEKFSGDVEWNNGESLDAQYRCHVIFAGAGKVPWNIEPHRTETDFGEVFKASCNPKN